MITKLRLVVYAGVLLVFLSGQALAQKENNAVIPNDPTILKALSLLPAQYSVPSEKVFLVHVSRLNSGAQKSYNGRAAFHIAGQTWMGVVSKSTLYTSAAKNTDSSPEMYALASAIYHEYWHLLSKHKGLASGISPAELAAAEAEETEALKHQLEVLVYFYKNNKTLRRSNFFCTYVSLIDMGIRSRSK